MKLALFALSISLSFACNGSADDDDDGSDTGTMDAAVMDAAPTDSGAMTVEIGTGIDDYQALAIGQDVMIAQGPQGGGRWGGFHVWHAARTRGLNPMGIMLSFHVYLTGTREEIAGQSRFADLQPDGSGGYVLYGVAPPFADCCQAANHDIIMRVEATDTDGATAADERQVHAMACRDFGGTDLCL